MRKDANEIKIGDRFESFGVVYEVDGMLNNSSVWCISKTVEKYDGYFKLNESLLDKINEYKMEFGDE